MKKLYVLTFFLMLSANFASSAPNSLTYQGRILKADGTPLEYNNVSFIFQVTDPTGQCILYQEQVNGISLANSGGVFDVPIGTGTVQFPTSGSFYVLDVFNNSTSIYNCSGGSTFNPATGDSRRLRVQFHDGTGWKLISPDSIIRTVPYAAYSLSAQKLGTNVANDFLLKAGVPACTGQTFLKWDGSGFSCAGVSGANGGTVTEVTSNNSYISISNGTANPQLTLNVGTMAGTVAAGNDARLVGSLQSGQTAGGDLEGTYPSPTVSKLSGTTLSVASLVAGNYLKYNGTSWVNANLSSSDLSDGSSLIKSSQMPANCSAGQTLNFSSPTGGWICADISVKASNFGTQNANSFLVGPTTGSAIPTFRTIDSTDLPSGLVTPGAYRSVTVDTYGRVIAGANPTTTAGYGISDAFVNGGNAFGGAATLGTNDSNTLGLKTNSLIRMTINTLGNVGIGTTSPTGFFDVQGGTASSGSGSHIKLVAQSGASNSNGGNIYLKPGAGPGTGSTGQLWIGDNNVPGYVVLTDSTGAWGADFGMDWSNNFRIRNDNSGPIVFHTNNGVDVVERMRIDSSGNVGIGTVSPRAGLDVNSVILAKAASLNGTATIDFSSGNIQYTNLNCGLFKMNNLKDGTTYSFIVKGTALATCSFTAFSDSGATALTVHLPPGHGATTTGKHTLYSLMVVGADVYYSWIPGY